MQQTQQSQKTKDEHVSINIHDLIDIFFRRRKFFLYVVLPIFFGILLVQFTKAYNPVYRSTFDIGVTQERPVEGFFSSYQEPTMQIGAVTQRVISNLLSVNLAEKVVDTLGLYAYLRKGDSDVRVEVKIKKDFSKRIGPLKLQIDNGRVKVFENGNEIKEGSLNEFIDMELFELKVLTQKKISDKKTYEIVIYSKDRMALALRNSLSIKVLEADKIDKEINVSKVPFSGEGASRKLVVATTIYPGINLIGILRINVHWGNPNDALEIAKVLSEKIIQEDIGEKSLQFVQSRMFIDSQLTLYQGNLTHLEEKIRLFKERKKIADLKASTQALINQISGLESKRNQLQIEEKILGNLGEYLISAKAGERQTPNFAAAMLSDPVLQSFYSQLLQTEAELKGKLKEYSLGHPKVLEVKAKLDGLKEQMREETAKRTSSIKTEIGSIESQISTLQAKLENVPDDEIQLARLERDRETAEKLYTFFAEKLEETRVQEAGVTSDLKIINPPVVSSSAVNSRRPILTLFVAFLISMLAGCVTVFAVEYLDNTVKDPEIVKTKLGLSIISSIPTVEDGRTTSGTKTLFGRFGRKRSKHKSDGAFRILDEDISSADFEAFKKLSMNLVFAHPEHKYHVIYVTSPCPEEGKTFIALNLGVVLGTRGNRVVIIDTDFRKKRGHLTDVAKLRRKEGLFNTLKGETRLEDVITKIKSLNAQQPASDTSGENVDLVPIGEIPPSPFVFLESEIMKKMISELRQQYDYIIIDGVPILLFADAAYLANFVDGVLLTARYGKTGVKELESARDILVTSKSNIIGLVMNGVPRSRGSYYYHYYQKYYSKYYHKET